MGHRGIPELSARRGEYQHRTGDLFQGRQTFGRTQQLLEYFGEVSYDKCGVCDVCISQKKHAADGPLLAHYEKQVLALLRTNVDLNLDGLVQVLDPEKRSLFLQKVAEMLDHGVLYYDDFGKIRTSR